MHATIVEKLISSNLSLFEKKNIISSIMQNNYDKMKCMARRTSSIVILVNLYKQHVSWQAFFFFYLFTMTPNLHIIYFRSLDISKSFIQINKQTLYVPVVYLCHFIPNLPKNKWFTLVCLKINHTQFFSIKSLQWLPYLTRRGSYMITLKLQYYRYHDHIYSPQLIWGLLKIRSGFRLWEMWLVNMVQEFRCRY